MKKMKISNTVVQELRLSRGWTQEQLAALCGRSVKTIQRVEKTGICSIETRSALASVFEVGFDQLDGRESIEQAAAETDAGVAYYNRIRKGNELVAVFQDTSFFRLTHEDPRDSVDAGLMSSFLQNVQDWSEIWSEIDAGARVSAAFSLAKDVEELENAGIWVFGLRTRIKYQLPTEAAEPSEWEGEVCNIHLAYENSQKIIVLKMA